MAMKVKTFPFSISNPNLVKSVAHAWKLLHKLCSEQDPQPRWMMDKPHKNSHKEIFICVNLRCLTFYFCVHSLLRLKAARPPLIICQVSEKKKRWIWAAPHGWAPRTLVVCVKPESRQADKMWNSWREQEGKFQTNIRTCGSLGAPKHFHVLDGQTPDTDIIWRDCFPGVWQFVIFKDKWADL